MSHVRSSADGPAQFDFADSADVTRFIDTLDRFERGEINADEWRAFRLVHGAYGQRQEGDWSMLRVKIPQGAITSPQLRVAADVAEKYSRGFVHLTTRQNFQFHFVHLPEVELAMQDFANAGVTTREACGNSVRNVTTSPTAGVAADEVFDVTPYSQALTRYFLRHPLSSTLPRKFKIAFSGGGADHAFAAINDIGWVAKVENGVRGFSVTIAGGTATLVSPGYVIREFLPAAEMFRLAEAVLRVFNRLGDRVHRHKNRMKFLVKQLGWEKFRAEVESEFSALDQNGPEFVLPFDPNAPDNESRPLTDRLASGVLESTRIDAILASAAAPREPFPEHLVASAPPAGRGLAMVDELGRAAVEADFRKWNVRAQKQPGYSWVLIHLPLGDITAARLRVLADVAEAFSDGTVRTTHDQNFILRWVQDAHVSALFQALARANLARPRRGGLDDVVSCPGAESCKLAVTRSRGVASLIHEHVAARPDLTTLGQNVTVHVSGCPNGCGLHHVSGIGLQGGMRKVGGKAVPQYFVYAGGGIGDASQNGVRFGKVVAKVPARRAPETIERLLGIWKARGQEGESFVAFIGRTDLKELRKELADLETLTEEQARPEDFVDLGETQAFEVTLSEGECVA